MTKISRSQRVSSLTEMREKPLDAGTVTSPPFAPNRSLDERGRGA